MHEINKDSINALQSAIYEALKPVGEAHGVTFSFGNAKYTDIYVDFKLTATRAATEDFDPAKAVWDRNTAFTPLFPEDYGKQVQFNGKDYAIAGYVEGAKKRCISIRDANGREFVTDIPTILFALGRTDPAVEQTKRFAFQEGAAKLGLDVAYEERILWMGRVYKLLEIRVGSERPILALEEHTNKRYTFSTKVLKEAEKVESV